MADDNRSSNRIRVGLSSPWNTLNPGLQHSLSGDLVLSNQFEALVGLNDARVSIPLGAKGWTVSDDFTVYRFEIDQNRRFPDGTSLCSYDFKNSWETAVRLAPISANSSLLDVLYKIEGFQSFEKSGNITGIETPDESTLILNFKSPFRMALEHLQGNRFAAFRVNGSQFVGTGKYTISEIDSNHVVMDPRSAEGSTPLSVKYINAEHIVDAFNQQEIDVIHYLSGHSKDISKLNQEDATIVAGSRVLHMGIGLNSLGSSIFKSKHHRKAFSTLINMAVRNSSENLPEAAHFEKDAQFYLPGQFGRLKDDLAQDKIKVGEPLIADFIEATKKHPLVIQTIGSNAYVLDLIKETGVCLSESSGVFSTAEYFKTIYSKDAPDAMVIVFGLASGDPDGLYHVLGRNGAITAPTLYNIKVGELLEEGREIVEIERLDEHYQIVSEAILDEVPIVHLGYAQTLTVMRRSRVEAATDVVRRNPGHLHFLRYKD